MYSLYSFPKVDESIRDFAMKIINDPELYTAHIPEITKTIEELALKKEYTSLTNKEETTLTYFILKRLKKN